MNKRRVKIFLFFIMITAATLSCNTVESELCELTGGKWVPVDYIENRPYDSDSAENECDRNFDPVKYQDWQLFGPAINSGGENDIQDGNNGEIPGEDGSESEENQPPPEDGHPSASQPAPEYAEPEDCNAADQLIIKYNPEVVTDRNYEITCEYLITFTNIGDQPMRVYFFKHKFFYTGEEESKWDNYHTFEPGSSYTYECMKEFRKSDEKTMFHYLEKVAPVLATDSCKNSFQNNSKNKEVIALPLQQLYCQ